MNLHSFFLVIFCLNYLFLLTFAQNLSYNEPELKHGRLGDKVCMPDLGCFEMTKDFFHPEFRPFNFLPESREMVETNFQLYTRQFPMEYTLVKYNDVDSMKEIDPSLRTIFIVHGFMDSNTVSKSRFNNAKWMGNLKDHLLLSGNYNVFIVDWSRGNMFPYTRATANSRVAGAEIALLIQSMKKNLGLDPKKVHIIGHSLGAHVAGYAGERTPNLGRITGLDPAGPYFINMPASVRLDPTDAQFVDVIHTDTVTHVMLALGLRQPCGHVDFYPNDGQKQPGCDKEPVESIFIEGLVDAGRRFVGCSHQRATDYLILSVNYKRAFPVGFQCDNWQDYLKGKCSDCGKNKCLPMGMRADAFIPYKNNSQSVKMYLATSTSAPYWQHIYQVSIKLQYSTTGNGFQGDINLMIYGAKNRYNSTVGPVSFVQGLTSKVLKYLVRDIRQLGKIKGLSFKWISKTINTGNIQVEKITIKPMTVTNEAEQSQQTVSFCNKEKRISRSNIAMEMKFCQYF